MLEVEDKPVIVLTALDYTFPLFNIIQGVYFLIQELLLFSQQCWWIFI